MTFVATVRAYDPTYSGTYSTEKQAAIKAAIVDFSNRLRDAGLYVEAANVYGSVKHDLAAGDLGAPRPYPVLDAAGTPRPYLPAPGEVAVGAYQPNPELPNYQPTKATHEARAHVRATEPIARPVHK